MRAEEWIQRRWLETGWPVAELAARSGVSEATLYRIQRLDPDYRVSGATVRLLGNTNALNYGAGASKYLVGHATAGTEVDPHWLDTIAPPVGRRETSRTA